MARTTPHIRYVHVIHDLSHFPSFSFPLSLSLSLSLSMCVCVCVCVSSLIIHITTGISKKAIARALMVNTSLKSLDLGAFNMIGVWGSCINASHAQRADRMFLNHMIVPLILLLVWRCRKCWRPRPCCRLATQQNHHLNTMVQWAFLFKRYLSACV